jgi:hypothetical protein
MFGSGILDTVIGLVFVFLLVSMLVTIINEIIAAVAGSRAYWLQQGIKRLLGSQWAQQMYAHPLIENTTKTGDAGPKGRGGPSYIPSRSFANVLMEIVQQNSKSIAACKEALQSVMNAAAAGNATVESLKAQLAAIAPELHRIGPLGTAVALDLTRRLEAPAGPGPYPVADAQADILWFIDGMSSRYVRQTIDEFPDPRIRTLLLSLFDDAKNDVDKFKENIEAWFNNGMDRVNGWYKRKSQWVLAGVGLAIAVLMNVDTILIFKHLQSNPVAREALVGQARAFTEAHRRPAPTNATEGVRTVISGEEIVGEIVFPKALENKEKQEVKIGSEHPMVKVLTPTVVVEPLATKVAFRARTEFADEQSMATITASIKDTKIAGAEFKLKLEPSLPAQFRAIQANAYALAIPIGWVAEGNSQEVKYGQIVPTKGGEYVDRVAQHILGWLLTALAATLGAPFWFDMLNRIISIRSSGKAPEERPKPPKEVSMPVEPGQSHREADRLDHG